jgi:hypothetical protein
MGRLIPRLLKSAVFVANGRSRYALFEQAKAYLIADARTA